MGDKTLTVDCPAREPDPVLLAQLTALAAASIPPSVKPWWQRFTAKSGAAAVAGVLIISGATAVAQHAHLTPYARPAQPVVATIAGSTGRVAPRHKSLEIVARTISPTAAVPVLRSMHHAGERAHRQHARTKKHQEANTNRGGSAKLQRAVWWARIHVPQQSTNIQEPFQESRIPYPRSHDRGHRHDEARSQS